MSISFPKAIRLRKRSQYLKFGRCDLRNTGRLIVLDQLSNNLEMTRLGVTVTRRYGKAHERNRFKRIVREAFRLAQHQLPSGLDLNIKPRSAAREASMQDIYEELIRLLS